MNRLALLVISIMMTIATYAQNKYNELRSSYNFRRGVDLFDSKNFEEAFRYFNAELESRPKNGYAQYYIAYIDAIRYKYDKALEMTSMAIKNIADDKYTLRFCYRLRAQVYDKLKKHDLAEKEYDKAIKNDPSDIQTYVERSIHYFELQKHQLAINDCQKILEINPAHTSAYILMAQINIKEGYFNEAVENCNNAEKIKGNLKDIYQTRAQAYCQLKKYGPAATDVFNAFSNNQFDGDIYPILYKLYKDAPMIMKLNMKARTNAEPNNRFWPTIAGYAYMNIGLYNESIEQFVKANETEWHPTTCSVISQNYKNLGNLRMAMKEINKAIEADSTNTEYLYERAEIFAELNMNEQALADCDRAINLEPNNAANYYYRAHIMNKLKMEDDVFDNFEMAHVMEPENTNFKFNYARLLLIKNRNDEAKALLEEIAQSTETDNDHLIFANILIGNNEMAMAKIDSMVQADNINDYYNIACMYSILGDKDNALKYLEKSVDTTWSNYIHLLTDWDFENIKDTEEFKAIAEKCKAKIAYYTDDDNNTTEFNGQEVVTEIPFTRENGVCKVKCTINGLPLYFVFDTGASDVSMSNIEASFMFKNDMLSRRDIIGTTRYSDANGDISEGTVVNINEVKFGDMVLNNVRAGVVNSQKAPLLLGQSVLSRLGRIEIDYDKKVIRIKK